MTTEMEEYQQEMWPNKKTEHSDLQISHTEKYFSIFTLTYYDRVATPYTLTVGNNKMNFHVTERMSYFPLN